MTATWISTYANGRGLCARHHIRELPGWTVETPSNGGWQPHLTTTTPTRHTYRSHAPGPP